MQMYVVWSQVESMTPQESGREWERIWAEKIGGKVVPGSGNQWYAKLDVRGQSITWSNKWTGNKSFSITDQMLKEIRQATLAAGGNGSIGAMAVRIESVGDVVVMPADDFLELMKSKPIIQAEKADNRRATARVPQLLREIDDS